MLLQPPLTLGDVARLHGLETWKVRRLFERGILDEPPRVGTYRVVSPNDLPRIEAALRTAGYLPNPQVSGRP